MQELLAEGISEWFAAYPKSDMRLTDNILELTEHLCRKIDPVPDDVRTITDGQGDDWNRNPKDPGVWIIEYGTMYRTIGHIIENYGPIKWEGKEGE